MSCQGKWRGHSFAAACLVRGNGRVSDDFSANSAEAMSLEEVCSVCWDVFGIWAISRAVCGYSRIRSPGLACSKLVYGFSLTFIRSGEPKLVSG